MNRWSWLILVVGLMLGGITTWQLRAQPINRHELWLTNCVHAVLPASAKSACEAVCR